MNRILCTGDSAVRTGQADKPTLAADEVLIRTESSALCGSELKDYRGKGCGDGNSGHEAAGTIAEVGAGVTTLKVGQRVGCSAIAGCGVCRQCQLGRYTWCSSFRFYGNMHSEFFKVAALACHVLPDDVGWDVGVLITGDGMGVPYHTSTKFSLPAGGVVAVFGLGPIGLGNVLMQTHLGRRVIGIDRSPARLAIAQRLGAAQVLAADEKTDVVRELRAMTDGLGPQVCIEAAGIPVTAKQCFAAVRTGGTVVFNGEQPALPLSPSDDFIRRDITAIGSWFYHFCEYQPMLKMYRAGLKVDSLITHRFDPQNAADAYRIMADGRCGKALIQWQPPT